MNKVMIDQISDFAFEFLSNFQAASGSITAIAAVFASTFAYIGLRTWRLQLKGSSEYTLAKDLLKTIYRVREGFKHVRNPAIFNYEYPKEMIDETGHLKRGSEADGTRHVYSERLKVLSEALISLEDRNLNAQVEWGADYARMIVAIRKCRNELLDAIRNLVEAKMPGGERRTKPEMSQERSILYYLGEDHPDLDKFTPEINAAVSVYEAQLRPIISRMERHAKRRFRASAKRS